METHSSVECPSELFSCTAFLQMPVYTICVTGQVLQLKKKDIKRKYQVGEIMWFKWFCVSQVGTDMRRTLLCLLSLRLPPNEEFVYTFPQEINATYVLEKFSQPPASLGDRVARHREKFLILNINAIDLKVNKLNNWNKRS